MKCFILCMLQCQHIFFSIWVFFHEHSRITGLLGKGEGNSLTPHYHFHPLHRHLDISRAINAERSPLHIAESWTWTGNLWFPRSLTTSFSYHLLPQPWLILALKLSSAYFHDFLSLITYSHRSHYHFCLIFQANQRPVVSSELVQAFQIIW